MDARRIVVFDFDGTLTVRDTLPCLLRGLARSHWHYLSAFVVCAPWLIAYKLRLLEGGKAKERLVSRLVKGMPFAEFETRCKVIAREHRDALLRNEVLARLEAHVKQGDEVYVCSANFDTWVESFLAPIAVPVVATGLEERDGVFTGRFATPNCNGEEKWKRMRERVEASGLPLTVYGDSRGDEALMRHAQEAFHVDKKGKVTAL